MGSSPGAITISYDSLFGDPASWPDQDLVSWSGTPDHTFMLQAYVEGVFPMPIEHPDHGMVMGWWSPDPRGVLELDNFRVTRSLRQSAKRYVTTIDWRFSEVVAACADPSRPYGWIDDDMASLVTRLHQAGFAHSVETWDADGRLVGGLYGVCVGGLFAGESMFHDPVFGWDASKVALARLVTELRSSRRPVLLDVQWSTPHLESLGVTEISREEYLSRVSKAVGGSRVHFTLTRRPGSWGM